jgi:hypothetical protein
LGLRVQSTGSCAAAIAGPSITTAPVIRIRAQIRITLEEITGILCPVPVQVNSTTPCCHRLIEPISVVRDSFGEGQLLQPLNTSLPPDFVRIPAIQTKLLRACP